MYHIYVLQSLKDNKYYIGQTANLEDRLQRHFEGREKSTRNRLPLKLVYEERYSTRKEAIAREQYLKSLKSHVAISNLIG